ncbi:MAG: hypothetical protein PHT53_04295, partial [Candidatus Omnitrophica bacterium]|nr:hypothetical protein [Candidatus Omnitrophota bacterium]
MHLAVIKDYNSQGNSLADTFVAISLEEAGSRQLRPLFSASLQIPLSFSAQEVVNRLSEALPLEIADVKNILGRILFQVTRVSSSSAGLPKDPLVLFPARELEEKFPNYKGKQLKVATYSGQCINPEFNRGELGRQMMIDGFGLEHKDFTTFIAYYDPWSELLSVSFARVADKIYFKIWISHGLRERGLGRVWYDTIVEPYFKSTGAKELISFWTCEERNFYPTFLQKRGFNIGQHPQNLHIGIIHFIAGKYLEQAQRHSGSSSVQELTKRISDSIRVAGDSAVKINYSSRAPPVKLEKLFIQEKTLPKALSLFFLKHRVLLAFLSALTPALAFLFLGFVKNSLYPMQLAFWLFLINTFASLVIFRLFSSNKNGSNIAVSFFNLFKALKGRDFIHLFAPALINVVNSIGIYYIFPHVSAEIILTCSQLGMFTTLFLAWVYNNEKHGWIRKTIGASIIALFGLAPMLINASLFNVYTAIIIVNGLFIGVKGPLWRRLYHNIYERVKTGNESAKDLFVNLPFLNMAVNYIVGLLVMATVVFVISPTPLFIFEGNHILRARVIVPFLIGISFFIVTWYLVFKLQQMLTYDISKFAPLSASGPMLSKIMEDGLMQGGFLSLKMYPSFVPALMVIFGAFIAAAGNSNKNKLVKLQKESSGGLCKVVDPSGEGTFWPSSPYVAATYLNHAGISPADTMIVTSTGDSTGTQNPRPSVASSPTPDKIISRLAGRAESPKARASSSSEFAQAKFICGSDVKIKNVGGMLKQLTPDKFPGPHYMVLVEDLPLKYKKPIEDYFESIERTYSAGYLLSLKRIEVWEGLSAAGDFNIGLGMLRLDDSAFKYNGGSIVKECIWFAAMLGFASLFGADVVRAKAIAMYKGLEHFYGPQEEPNRGVYQQKVLVSLRPGNPYGFVLPDYLYKLYSEKESFSIGEERQILFPIVLGVEAERLGISRNFVSQSLGKAKLKTKIDKTFEVLEKLGMALSYSDIILSTWKSAETNSWKNIAEIIDGEQLDKLHEYIAQTENKSGRTINTSEERGAVADALLGMIRSKQRQFKARRNLLSALHIGKQVSSSAGSSATGKVSFAATQAKRITEITVGNFEEFLGGRTAVVSVGHREYCHACQEYGPGFEKVALGYAGADKEHPVEFATLDIP